ncbi:MAG: hypothetical protein U0165_02655 [Polyangiaceae bacterium]
MCGGDLAQAAAMLLASAVGETEAGSASGGVTWTQLYNEVFGPTGTSHCTGSSCHTNTKGGFEVRNDQGRPLSQGS